MSNYTRQLQNYALNQPVNFQNPNPIIANRAPTTADKAPIGQSWIYTTANSVYVLTSIVNNAAQWQLLEVGGGGGVFATLTVNPGPTNLSTVGNGAVTIGNATNTGALTISVGTGNFVVDGNGNTIGIGDDAASNTVIVGSTNTASTTTINSGGTGQILLQNSNGLVRVNAPSATPVASPTAAVTANNRIGQVVFTGFTTASAAQQSFTITNLFSVAASVIFVTASNGGTNLAYMTVIGVVPAVNSFVVTLQNNGAAALNGNIYINFWLVNP